jgi:hypothetical protein
MAGVVSEVVAVPVVWEKMTVPLAAEVTTFAVHVVCVPTVTLEGAQPTEVELMKGVTVISKVGCAPALAPLCESPVGYDA